MTTTPITTLEQVLDLECAKFCGECSEPLDPPGSPCPACGELPDETRQEAAERLAAGPDPVARAEAVRLRALGLAYLVAAEQTLRAADHVEYRSELRRQRDHAQDRLGEAVSAHEQALAVLGEALKSEKVTAGPLADALRIHGRRVKDEEAARRLRKGAEAETEAADRVTSASRVLSRYQAEAGAAARVRETAEGAVRVAEQAVRDREQGRDTAQLLLERHATVPLSGETAVMLLTPLMRLAVGRDVEGRALDMTERVMVGMFGEALRTAAYSEYADALDAANERRIREKVRQEFLSHPQLRTLSPGHLAATFAPGREPAGKPVPGGVSTPAPLLSQQPAGFSGPQPGFPVRPIA